MVSIIPFSRRLVLVLLAVVVAASTLGVSTAMAGPLVTASPSLKLDPLQETGKVGRVSDGDTIQVDIAGDGTTALKSVRLTGINAMEIGQCNADLATNRLKALVDGKTVRLHAGDVRSNASGRLLRAVMVQDANGRWFDVNHRLLRDGMGLWFPFKPELTNLHPYRLAADEARAAGRGIWDDTRCGSGPNQGSNLSMWVKSDADGADGQNLTDEYVVITNHNSSTDVKLGGWWVRDSSLFSYTIPSGTVLKAGQRLTIRVGKGTDSASVKYMNRSSAMFENVDLRIGMGDGGYLFDPHGDLRVSFVYPYNGSAIDPLAGAVAITKVVYDPPGTDTANGERVTLRNVSGRRVTLDPYQLRSWPYAHAFRHNTYLDPNESLTVVVGRGTSTRTLQYWGKSSPILGNGGDVVELLSWDERRVDCVAWGSSRCPAIDTSTPAAATPFTDVPAGHPQEAAIASLFERKITTGCSSTRFCPKDRVTRAQMASFIARAAKLPAGPAGTFSDVSGTHKADIDALAAAGITMGCGSGRFCPDRLVTRAEVASLVQRTLELKERPASFSDVRAGSTHAGAIGALAHKGIISGYADGRFRPDDPMIRAHMASLLVRAFPG